MKLKYYVLKIQFVVLIATSIFFTSSRFVDEKITPKYYSAIIFISAIIIFYSIISISKPIITRHFTKFAVSTIAIISTLEAFYTILQYHHLFPSNSIHPENGSFDNSAGLAACLCTGLPCILSFIQNKEKKIRNFATASILIILYCLILSKSRTGLITSLSILSLYLFRQAKVNKSFKAIIVVTISIICFIFYFAKKNSADGRMLIWNCSWQMVKDRPILGYGFGGFNKNYMYYQADYFSKKPNSRFKELADNVISPFNEYLHFICNFGIIGLLFCSIAAILLAFFYMRGLNDKCSLSFIYCLISIGIFSFFSYPFTYPFVIIIFILSCCYFVQKVLSQISIAQPFRVLYRIIIVLLLLTLSIKSYYNMKAEMRWKSLTEIPLSDHSKAEALLRSYNDLLPYLKKNPSFLYNYAAVLNRFKKYRRSLEIATKCQNLWESYYIELLIGDNFYYLGKYRESIKHYKIASLMCPVRFLPLYKLVTSLVVEGNNNKEIDSLAQQIIKKNEKIPSKVTTDIKNEMRKLRKQLEQQAVP